MDWECKLCHTIKSGGAPQLRDHFLGGYKKMLCTHPSAPKVANRLREEHKKKELKKYPTSTINVSRVMEEKHGSNLQTPKASPGCTPTPSIYPNSLSSKHHFDKTQVPMPQASLHESLHSNMLDDAA